MISWKGTKLRNQHPEQTSGPMSMIYSPRPPTRKKIKCKKQEEQNSKRIKRRAPSPPRKLETVQKKEFEERKSLKQTSQVWFNFGVPSAVAQHMLRLQNLLYGGEVTYKAPSSARAKIKLNSNWNISGNLWIKMGKRRKKFRKKCNSRNKIKIHPSRSKSDKPEQLSRKVLFMNNWYLKYKLFISTK